MPMPKSNKDRGERQRLTAEFTTGQLVAAICVSLFFALTCFLLGIFVGKYDSSLHPPKTIHADADNPAQEDAQEDQSASARTSEPARQGTQVTPRADLIRPKDKPAGNANASTLRPHPNAKASGGPRITELPPLPPTRAPIRPAALPTRISKPQNRGDVPTRVRIVPNRVPAVKKPPAREPEPVKEAKLPSPSTSPVPNPTPAPPPPTVEPRVKEKAPVTAAEPPKLPPAAASLTGWGIQLAAFLGDDRAQKAGDFRRRLKENAGIDAEIVVSQGAKSHQIVVVGYTGRKEADAACAELRKKAAFESAWVRALP